MNFTSTWTLDINNKMSAPINVINGQGKKVGEIFNNSFKTVQEQLEAATKKANTFGDCLKRIKPIDWMAVGNSIGQISDRLKAVTDVGANFDAGLREVSAITGVTGEELDKLGSKARDLAKDFGTTATENLDTFKTILSRLGPQIGENQAALQNMGKYANVLSKTMGGDVVGASDALTTSLLQFKVNLNDPIEAASEMERMMNAMAAGAQEGASEVPQISQALEQAGGMAKLANVSFEETNSALQALAQSGKYGAEAGVGLRNVLIKMNAPSALSKEAVGILDRYGVNMRKVSDASAPFADRLKELQKIGKSTDALTLVFAAENVQAAQGLIQSAQFQEELTQKITGTNVAYEQSQTIMEGWTEKMKRAKAWVDDLKIGTFNFTSVLGVGFGALSETAQLTADLSASYSGLAPVVKSAGSWFRQTALAQKVASVWTNVMTAAQTKLNIAMSLNVVGAIVVAIAALVAIVVVAIKKYDEWGAALLLILGPIGYLITAIKSLYDHWESIKNAFKTDGIIGGLKRVGIVLLDALLKPMQQLLQLLSNIPGLGKLAGNGALKIETIRKNLNLITPGEKQNKSETKSTTKKEKATATGTVDSTVFFPKGGKENGKEKSIKGVHGSGSNDGMSMSGAKGNRTINMTLTINNSFSVSKGIGSIEHIANKITGAINDRMRDGLVALD